MKINEVAKLTGLTIRTLHYYDEIGLLVPSDITDAGYRIYNDEALEILQQILFFRELDFSLSDIKEIITNPNYNKNEALLKHKELLTKKRERIDGLITLLNTTIKGDKTMSFKEFDMSEINAHKEKYAKEVTERWGNTDAYKESEQKTSSYTEADWRIINNEGAEILRGFGEMRHTNPASDEAQTLVKRWQEHISKSYYTCTNEILKGLGLMYIGDERFTKNLNQNGEGTADFMAKAIEIYCEK